MKKVLFTVMTLCLLTSMVIPQTMDLKPFGMSPRDVALGRVDASLDRAYNGLLNVGIETQMYLKGVLNGAALSGPTWTVLEAPTGSGATLSTPVEVDTSTQIVAFTPDVEGTYKISFDSEGVADTVVVNSGMYKGIEEGQCGACHSDKKSAWEGTGHYAHFEDGMNGLLGSYYSSYCIGCHTTGYDSNANNDGFDDRTQVVDIHGGADTTFVFPDSAALVDFYGSPDGHLFEGVYDSLEVFYPNSMKLARVQCESCHGPGSAHYGNTTDSKIVQTLTADVCALCHDSGTHHVYPEQWDVAGHSHPPTYPTGPGRASCAGCHTPGGFIQVAEGAEVTDNEGAPFSCAMCHDPHDATNEHQLRTVEATLADGTVVTEGGMGKLCMNCHHQRRDDVEEYTNEPHSHFGPHYGVQADMLMATNAITFGEDLPSSPHLSAVENTCVDCHMFPGHVDENDNVILVGSHTFNVKDPNGKDNVVICEQCHGNVGESFNEKKLFIDGNADHDADGVDEGVQKEVRGLMRKLANHLPAAEGHDAYDPHDDPDSTWSTTEIKAAFNYDYVYYDGSAGIHNPRFAISLLKASLRALRALDMDDVVAAALPIKYGLSQNFPNPFNPVTTINYSMPENGLVTLTVYNSLGQVVKELVGNEMEAGRHNITFSSDNLSSGLYFYEISVNSFRETKKMVLVK